MNTTLLNLFCSYDAFADLLEARVAASQHVTLKYMAANSDSVQTDLHSLTCRYDALADLLEARAKSSEIVTLNYITANSVDKAIEDSVSSDLYLVAISVAIFITLAIAFMSRYGIISHLKYQYISECSPIIFVAILITVAVTSYPGRCGSIHFFM